MFVVESCTLKILFGIIFGTIPSLLSKLTKLQSFSLYSNNLSMCAHACTKKEKNAHLHNWYSGGTIPSELSAMSELVLLSVSNNELGIVLNRRAGLEL